MSKKLNITKIRQQAKDLDELVDITVLDPEGNEYSVKLKPKFRETDVQKVVVNTIESIQGLEKADMPIATQLVPFFVIYNIIKVQTDLDTPKLKDYKKEENFYKADAEFFINMYDLGYLEQINSAFIGEEVDRVFDLIMRMDEAIGNETDVEELIKKIDKS